MKSLKNIHLFAFLISLIYFFWISNSYAAGIVDIGESRHIQNIFNVGSTGELRDTILLLLDKVIWFLRLALNGVALLAMLYVGFLWVTSMGDEEKVSNGKNKIILVILWLFLINIPEALYRIFTGSDYRNIGFDRKLNDVRGQISSWNVSTSISQESAERCNFFFCSNNTWWINVDSIIPMLETIMLVVAVVMFTIWGFKMLLWWSEESAETAKKRIGYWVIALLITGFLEMIYRAVFFQTNLTGTAEKIISILTKISKFFIYLAGPIAIISIIIWGYYFITSAGDEEKADKGKKILVYTFFATIMLLLGYTFLIEIVGLNLF
jgi:hypothetical protein